MSGVPAPAPGAPGAPPPAAPAPGAPGAPALWHNGIEAETLGFWQNKGWKTDEPKAFATELTKSYRELEKHFGVPPEQLAKLPGPTAKPEDVKAFWSKLGVPGKPEDYDLSSLQIDGKPLDDGFVAGLRNAFAGANVAKDKAGSIAEAFIKWMNDGDAREKTMLQSKIDQEIADLKTSWGGNYEYNMLRADEGARKFGLTKEEATSIGNSIGTARAAEMFRRIGEGLKEDGLVTGAAVPGAVPRTAEAAQARLNELKADKDWNARMVSGRSTPAERDEFYTLSAMAVGEARIL
jgi:hypothetical protein